MKRRAKTGGGRAKTRQRRTRRAVHGKAPRPAHRKSAGADARSEVARLTRELNEAHERETAATEVLRVISNSLTDTQPVFDAIVEGALKLFPDAAIAIALPDGDQVRAAAIAERDPEHAKFWKGTFPNPLSRKFMHGTAILDRRVVDVPDAEAHVAASGPFIEGCRVFLRSRYRAITIMPMLRGDTAIGAISVARPATGPLTVKQVALLRTFADQAVIAIENVRLLKSLEARTAELSNALEQQTATADVLRVISSSQGDLEPVFIAMLDNAVRICDARFGSLFRYDGTHLNLAARVGTPPALVEFQKRGPFVPEAGAWLDWVVRNKKIRHTPDATLERVPGRAADLGGARSIVYVPMLKDDQLIGVIVIYRTEVRPFTDRQIELVKNFAAQAVIAIENARLLDELRQSLQQQTATADVLKVISRSAFDLPTVLNTLVESAARLCDSDIAYIGRPKGGDLFSAEASYGMQPAFKDLLGRTRWKPGRESALGRVLLERAPAHILDAGSDPEYRMTDLQRIGGYRSVLGVPLMREGAPIGVLVLGRNSVRAFTDRQTELVVSFADQAVIAIENVRLFDEIQDKSRQLAEASRHKSQFLANMSHELRTPLNAILGYTELITDSVYGEPPQKMLAVLKRLEANGKHLLGLINEVLDLSKIEAGQFKLELADYSLQDIAQTVRSALEPLAADKALAFKLEVAPDLPSGHGDKRRLTQVLINLAGNAIKFTDAGEVAITIGMSNGSFAVAVRDTGPGISLTDQAKLFREFQQGDNAVTRAKGGTGLGLAISKRIIEIHGGRIWVDSAPGRGSTFSFTLPVSAERDETG